MNYLLFADNCLIFYEVSMQEVQPLHDILHQHESASGQQVNREKFRVFFSRMFKMT